MANAVDLLTQVAAYPSKADERTRNSFPYPTSSFLHPLWPDKEAASSFLHPPWSDKDAASPFVHPRWSDRPRLASSTENSNYSRTFLETRKRKRDGDFHRASSCIVELKLDLEVASCRSSWSCARVRGSDNPRSQRACVATHLNKRSSSKRVCQHRCLRLWRFGHRRPPEHLSPKRRCCRRLPFQCATT